MRKKKIIGHISFDISHLSFLGRSLVLRLWSFKSNRTHITKAAKT
jgi:hypothetical protein